MKENMNSGAYKGTRRLALEWFCCCMMHAHVRRNGGYLFSLFSFDLLFLGRLSFEYSNRIPNQNSTVLLCITLSLSLSLDKRMSWRYEFGLSLIISLSFWSLFCVTLTLLWWRFYTKHVVAKNKTGEKKYMLCLSLDHFR